MARERRVTLDVEQDAGAEIEQLYLSVDGDQHVIGFQIPMNNQLAMYMVHRIAHLQKEAQAGLDIQLAAVTVLVEPNAFDVLHRQIRIAERRRASVEQVRDVRMVQGGQQPPLRFKAAQEFGSVQEPGHDFEGHGLLKKPVGTLGSIDGARPAAT